MIKIDITSVLNNKLYRRLRCIFSDELPGLTIETNNRVESFLLSNLAFTMRYGWNAPTGFLIGFGADHTLNAFCVLVSSHFYI